MTIDAVDDCQQGIVTHSLCCDLQLQIVQENDIRAGLTKFDDCDYAW